MLDMQSDTGIHKALVSGKHALCMNLKQMQVRQRWIGQNGTQSKRHPILVLV